MTGLRGRPVTDIMERDCPTVEGHLTLKDFVDEYLLRTGRRCFIVVQNHNVCSKMASFASALAAKRASWSTLPTIRCADDDTHL
jgi:hypothetical protein